MYIISEDLRDVLIGLIIVIQNASYDDKIWLKNGKIIKVPYLKEIKKDLYNLDKL